MGRYATKLSLAVVALVVALQSAPSPALAKQFDVTGTLDCGVRSGRKCTFADWSTGPTLGVLTRDFSGNLERVVLNASWVRDSLTAFDQDDFVWFTVDDQVGPMPQIISVVEHHCNDGTLDTGLVNGSGSSCSPTEHKKKDD
ncbi:MAG: hypothetical protein IT307_16180 [Chloroflexi bacterium]|nr:hypothetical protein [Chloroflexota bacterium]